MKKIENGEVFERSECENNLLMLKRSCVERARGWCNETMEKKKVSGLSQKSLKLEI